MSVEPGGLVTSAEEEPTKRKDFCQLWTEKVKNAASIGKVVCPIFKDFCCFITDSRNSRKVMRLRQKAKLFQMSLQHMLARMPNQECVGVPEVTVCFAIVTK